MCVASERAPGQKRPYQPECETIEMVIWNGGMKPRLRGQDRRKEFLNDGGFAFQMTQRLLDTLWLCGRTRSEKLDKAVIRIEMIKRSSRFLTGFEDHNPLRLADHSIGDQIIVRIDERRNALRLRARRQSHRCADLTQRQDADGCPIGIRTHQQTSPARNTSQARYIPDHVAMELSNRDGGAASKGNHIAGGAIIGKEAGN